MTTAEERSISNKQGSQSFLRISSRIGVSGLPRQINIMLVLGFVQSLGRNMAFPYLAMFLTGSFKNGGLQFDPSLVGFMIMIGGLANTFALLVTGSLCDRFGRKRMMLASIVPLAALIAAFAYAHTYTEFLLLYAATAILGSLYDPAYNAMVADLVEPVRREEVYGLSYMIGNIGTMIGPPVGGVLAAVGGYPILFVYAAFFMAATVIPLIFLIKESCPEGIRPPSLAQFAGILRDRIFILFCVIGALTNLVYSQLYGMLSVYTQYVGFQPFVFGIFFSVNGAMVVGLQIPIRKGTMRLGSTRAFMLAQLLYAAGFMSFMFASGFFEFLAGIVILTLGEIVFVPASSGFVANLAPADMRGRYMAMAGLFFGVGGAAGSFLAFSIFDALGDKRLVWGYLGVIGFMTLIGYAYLFRLNKKKGQRTGIAQTELQNTRHD